VNDGKRELARLKRILSPQAAPEPQQAATPRRRNLADEIREVEDRMRELGATEAEILRSSSASEDDMDDVELIEEIRRLMAEIEAGREAAGGG
jgi:hypothetical protein